MTSAPSGQQAVLHFLIFSFNRGEFLQHCVESIQLCAPGCAITVWDDNSTDAATRDVLLTLADQVDVQQPPLHGNPDGGKHGGLYNNLQSAWTALPEDTLICCIQDDMQLVRPLQAEEILQWQQMLQSGTHKGFVQPAFLKAKTADTHFLPEKNAYTVDRQHRSAGAFYSDVFMTSTRLLRAAGWQFKYREAENEQQARQTFDQMVYLKNPFVAWLPGAPAWRGKRRTLAMRWAEKSRRCGFYPLNKMSAEQSADFCQRPEQQLPLAEKFLTLRSGNLPHPWFYYPLQNKRGLKLLNRIELLISRIFQSSSKA